MYVLKHSMREQARKVGGVGTLRYPLLSDITKSISQKYSAPLRTAAMRMPHLVCSIMHELGDPVYAAG